MLKSICIFLCLSCSAFASVPYLRLEMMSPRATQQRRKSFPQLEWLFGSRDFGTKIDPTALAALDLDQAFSLYFANQKATDAGLLSSYFEALGRARLADRIPDSAVAMARSKAIDWVGSPEGDALRSTWRQFQDDFDELFEVVASLPAPADSMALLSLENQSKVRELIRNQLIVQQPRRGLLGKIGNRWGRYGLSDQIIITQAVGNMIFAPSFADFHNQQSESRFPEVSRLMRLVVLGLNRDFKWLRGPYSVNSEATRAFDRTVDSLSKVFEAMKESSSPAIRLLADFANASAEVRIFSDEQRLGLAAIYDQVKMGPLSFTNRWIGHLGPNPYYEALYKSLRKSLVSVAEMRDLIDEMTLVLSESDLIVSAANAAKEWRLVSPQFDTDPTWRVFSVSQGHNFILFRDDAKGASVPYDIHLGTVDSEFSSVTPVGKPRPTKVEILTGSNSKGKTTYSKALGQLAIAAMQGLPVPAKALRISSALKGVAVHFSERQEASVTGSGAGRWATQQKGLSDLTQSATQEPFLFIIDEGLDGSNILTTGIALEGVIRFLAQEPSVQALSVVTTHRGDVIATLEKMPGVRLTRAQDDFHQAPGVTPAESYAGEALQMLTQSAHPELAKYIEIARERQMGSCDSLMRESKSQ